ncbi:MAG TPA: hypothetical protein VL283_04310 [Candidatus Baltobacteraceae bacterium]|nr:hypothetical protein [Candidatus Baltobacteraceae bacterium]
MTEGTFVLIIGPTAVGKSSVLTEVLKRRPDATHVLSTTCRAPRKNETPDVDMHFLSCDAFQEHAAAGDFFEHAKYSEHWYGTSRSGLRRALTVSPLAIKIVEIQGARIIKKLMPEAVTIFIKPGSFDDLEPRLRARNPPMREEDIQKRLAAAPIEIAASGECDHVIINRHGYLEACIRDVLDVLRPFAKTA